MDGDTLFASSTELKSLFEGHGDAPPSVQILFASAARFFKVSQPSRGAGGNHKAAGVINHRKSRIVALGVRDVITVKPNGPSHCANDCSLISKPPVAVLAVSPVLGPGIQLLPDATDVLLGLDCPVRTRATGHIKSELKKDVT
jgi:hypothetical protein